MTLRSSSSDSAFCQAARLMSGMDSFWPMRVWARPSGPWQFLQLLSQRAAASSAWERAGAHSRRVDSRNHREVMHGLPREGDASIATRSGAGAGPEGRGGAAGGLEPDGLQEAHRVLI